MVRFLETKSWQAELIKMGVLFKWNKQMMIFIYFGDYYLKYSQDADYQGIRILNRTAEQKRRNPGESRGDLLVEVQR